MTRAQMRRAVARMARTTIGTQTPIMIGTRVALESYPGDEVDPILVFIEVYTTKAECCPLQNEEHKIQDLMKVYGAGISIRRRGLRFEAGCLAGWGNLNSKSYASQ